MNDSPQAQTSLLIHIQIEEPFVFDAADIRRVVEETLRREGVSAAELTIAVTDDEAVRTLNRQYRNVDAPTDVLSFASRDAGTEVEDGFVLPPEMAQAMSAYLGDIVIAYPYAARQAARFDNSVEAELRLLAVHGTLHLLGYDHDSPEAEAAMWAIQETVLAHFGDRGLTERTYDD